MKKIAKRKALNFYAIFEWVARIVRKSFQNDCDEVARFQQNLKEYEAKKRSE